MNRLVNRVFQIALCWPLLTLHGLWGQSSCTEAHTASAEEKALIAPVDRAVRMGKVDEALEQIQKAIAAHPNDSLLEGARARVLYRRGELMPAVEAINLAIKLDRCNTRAHYDAWKLLATAGQYDAAEAQLDIAQRLSPASSIVHRMWLNTTKPPAPGVVVDTPPHFNFYARHMDCDGIPVRGALVVDSAALVAACGHIQTMLAQIPNVRANMVAFGAELHILGEDQVISDLPENREERGERLFAAPAPLTVGDAKAGPVTPAPKVERVDIDVIAGATGGVYSNCPEVNVLHMPGDGYGPHSEVCIHEFAHDIMGTGFDQGMRDQIEKQYQRSMSKGLWKGAYAATNAHEFWAELSAWYFGAQGGVGAMVPPIPAPGPEALRAYDPEAYALVDRFYSGEKQPKRVKMHEVAVVRGLERSNLTPDPAELEFVNDTPGRRHIYWVSMDGAPHDFGVVEPYSRRVYRCYTYEYWMVRDLHSKDYLLIYNRDTVSEVVIR